jgi:phage shock protein PspC (stress-responsive transcriptional regulator)
VDVTLVRIILLALAFYGGVGLIAYIVAWIVMPKDVQSEALPAGSSSPLLHN